MSHRRVRCRSMVCYATSSVGTGIDLTGQLREEPLVVGHSDPLPAVCAADRVGLCFTQSSRRAPRPPASLALFTALAFDVRRFHIPMVCLFVCGSVCCKRHCCSSRTMPPGPLRPCRLSYVCCRLLSPAAAPSHGCAPRTARARIWGLVCVRVRASLHARLGAC